MSVHASVMVWDGWVKARVSEFRPEERQSRPLAETHFYVGDVCPTGRDMAVAGLERLLQLLTAPDRGVPPAQLSLFESAG